MYVLVEKALYVLVEKGLFFCRNFKKYGVLVLPDKYIYILYKRYRIINAQGSHEPIYYKSKNVLLKNN